MIFGFLLAAQALLSDWLSSKLRLELEMEEEDDLICSAERRNPAALAGAQPAALTYDNFDGKKPTVLSSQLLFIIFIHIKAGSNLTSVAIIGISTFTFGQSKGYKITITHSNLHTLS